MQRAAMPQTLTRIRIGWTTLLEYRRLGERFDLVEYPDWNAEGWALAAVRSLPLVAQLHGVPDIWEHNGKAPTVDVRWASFLERQALQRAHVVIGSSEAHVRAHKEIGWFPKRDVEVIPLEGA
jgi:hypothetical protein